MTIHLAPIPSLRIIWQALFSGFSDGDSWRDLGSNKHIQFYSYGRLAMAEAVKIILAKKGKEKGRVWVPDYFCNEVLIPLRLKKISLYFYPVKEDLSPDWEKIKMGVGGAYPPDVFVLVHYFGFSSSLDESKAFCDNCGAELLEDCAHLLAPVNGAGQNTAVFSPRKLLSLPEGGLLIMSDNSSFQQVKKEFSAGTKLTLKWLALRLSQRLMLVLGISWHYFRDLAGGNAKICSTDKISGNMKMSTCKFTLKLLTVIEKSFKQILKKRRINYMRLSRGADAVKGVKLLFSSLPDYVCPYIFPMIVSDGRDVMLRQLNHFGIPAASWPDLPLEVLKRPEQHEAAIWLKDHILLLPLHQDLSNEQVEYMVFKLKEILEKKG